MPIHLMSQKACAVLQLVKKIGNHSNLRIRHFHKATTIAVSNVGVIGQYNDVLEADLGPSWSW